MIAWVLIVSMGLTTGYAISGIASEQACKELGAKIKAGTFMSSPSINCYPYDGANDRAVGKN